MLKPLVHSFALAIMGLPLSVEAVLIRSGFFSGQDMVPMQGTTMRQLEAEPAAVLFFTPEAASIDETSRFDQWYRDPGRPKINAYAVSVGPEETPFDVIAEVLRQRELKVPTFHIRGGNLLQGKEFRLLLLDNGGQVRRAFENLDFAALEQELNFQRSSAGASGTVTATNNADQVTTDVGHLQTNEPLYRNHQFRMQVEFPPDWTYRVARSNDGAIAKSPETGRVDLRIWALPDSGASTDPGTGASVAISPVQYIEDYLEGISELNHTRVSVDRRLVVEDDDARGRDYVYSYTRLLDPEDPGAGSIRYRGRIQAFVYDGFVKAAAAEGPVGEFDAMSQEIIEPFFLSFHPKLEPVNVPVSSTDAEPPASAAPAGVSTDNSRRIPSRTRFF